MGRRVLGAEIAAKPWAQSLQEVSNVHGTDAAFAAISTSGRDITWVDPARGADSEGVQDQLRDVQHIAACEAFAASRADGGVITWGRASTVWSRISFITSWRSSPFYISLYEFIALRAAGAIVTCGERADCFPVPEGGSEKSGSLPGRRVEFPLCCS